MPASPWRTLGSSDPNGEVVALLSYLPLKSYWRVVPFFLYTVQVMKQLASAQGCSAIRFSPARCASISGLSPRGRTPRRCKGSYSTGHVRIMEALTPHMDKAKFVRWTVKGSQLPLRWEEALRRMA